MVTQLPPRYGADQEQQADTATAAAQMRRARASSS
jgi:hypothetical protein